MFIDDAGVTGFFGAENIFSTSEGKLSGDWVSQLIYLKLV